RFRLAELISMGERVRHNLALRAVGTLTSSRLTLGRCLLAIQETGDFKKHGCSCSTHYAVAKLGMEKREANEFKRVARALTLLPELSLAAEEGRIAWGKLREIVRVAAEETEEYWLQLAGRYNDKQIQALVSKTPRGAVPGEVDLEETAYRSYFQCPFDPETSVLYDAAKRAFSLKQNKAMTHAEFMKELLTSYQAGQPLDEESKAKVLEEADKDLQAERARLIPVVAEARETAVEMGLIEADEDVRWGVGLDPRRVQSERTALMLGKAHGTTAINEEFISQVNPHRVGSKQTAKLLAEALGAESYDEKLISQTNPHRVQADHSALLQSDAYATPSTNEEFTSQVNPHRVQPGQAAKFLVEALGEGGDGKIISPTNPHRVQSGSAAELLADALGIASIDEELLAQLDPVRVRIDPVKNPWASTRVRFTINARSTTKAQSREILRRDCWCCSTPGCPNRIWLHIHHLESFSKGGKTEPGNLIGLCSACHKNTHDGLLKIERQSDGRLLFFDQFGSRLDRQVDLHIAEWLDYEIGWTGGEHNSYKARCGIDWSAVSA
ncbi:MAG TPA: HNH endonuclease, partial [Phycisphaerales bacterium]|nr:HNH endonuclease [Phycisphaerales bacterium]